MGSMKRNMKRNFATVMLVAIFACLGSGIAEASTAASNFPWEASLKALADSLTGPVAFALGLFMIVCGFCAVAFVGSELGGWVRWVAMAAILAGMLGAAPTVLDLFGLKAAIII